MDLHFYQCEICGKIITVLSDTKVPTICCGKPMKELIANGRDGAFEKHVPAFCVDGNKVHVLVGSKPHPMEKDHYITWIGLKTAHGFQFRELKPEDRPEAHFTVCDTDCVEGVYAFCNLHGLWFSDKEV